MSTLDRPAVRLRIRAAVFLGLLSSLVAAHAAVTHVATAARGADLGAVRAQVAAGANVNLPESDGTTALLWAT